MKEEIKKMKEDAKKAILEAVSKMLDEDDVEVLVTNKLNISGSAWSGQTHVSCRGQVIVIESGLPEAIPLLDRHDFVVSR